MMACCISHMRKLAPFYMFLLLALWSCGAPYVYRGTRDSYNVIAPDKFPFYKEPSFKKGPFYLEKPEEFVVEALVCSEDYIFCGYLPSFKPLERLFFKIRFKSGETGYIRYNDRYAKSEYITYVFGPRYDPQHYKNVDLDSVWNAAKEAFHEMYFVIRFMSKEDGYISAE